MTIDDKIYVQKISCDSLNEKEAEKIIDKGIREAFFNNLKEGKQTLSDIQTHGILLPYQIKGKAIFARKIRVKAKPTSPLVIKQHHNVSNTALKEYKQKYYVVNDENYLLAIYRGKNEKQKELSYYCVLNLLKAVCKKQQGKPLYSDQLIKQNTIFPLYKVIKIGKTVLLKETEEEDIFSLPIETLWNRIYRIVGLASSGASIQIKLTHCSSAQPWTYLKGKYNLNDKADFRLFSPSNIYCLVEDIDFKVLPTGKIEPLPAIM